MPDGLPRTSPRLTMMAGPLVEDWSHLARNMRPDEEEQFLAITGFGAYDAQQSARVMIATGGPKWALIGPDGFAVAAGGFEPERPGVVNGWAVASMDSWDRHWRSITKTARRLMADLFDGGDIQRIQIYALESRQAACDWYARGLGMVHEGTHLRFYANGETAVSYARTIDMHLRERRREWR